jgi:hypothetical protein
MSETQAHIERMQALDAAGRHDELLACLQQRYAETEQSPAPARTDYFMTMFKWKMLIEQYAPAAEALARARDEQARRLLGGEPYAGTAPWLEDRRQMFDRVERFALIVDMNETLADPRATHALFLQLEARQPELARRYAWRALPAIVEAGDVALADRYRGDPLELLDTVNDSARTWTLFPPGRAAPRLAAELMNLTREARIGIAVLRGLGREAEADAVRDGLLRGLANEELRTLAERELEEPGTISRKLAEHQTTLYEAAQASQLTK